MSRASTRQSSRHPALSARGKSEAKELASSVLDAESIDFLDPGQFDQALLGLRALRHQSIVRRDRPRQSRADLLIARLEDRQRARSVAPRSVAPPIADDERDYFNSKIDLLLGGSFILDSLEPSVIPKFEALLRERRPTLVCEHRYEAASKVDELLSTLNSIRAANRKKMCDIERLQELIGEFRAKIRTAELRGQRQAQEHERALGRLQKDRDREAELLNLEQRERDAAFEDEREDIEMGLSFRPSARLCERRQTEVKLARSAAFRECADARAEGDALEAVERSAFDAAMRKALAARERAAEEEAREKRRAHEAFWGEKIGALERARAKEAEDGEREIARYRKRIAELEEQIAASPDMEDDLASPRRARSQARRPIAVEPEETPPLVPLDVETGVYEEETPGGVDAV